MFNEGNFYFLNIFCIYIYWMLPNKGVMTKRILKISIYCTANYSQSNHQKKESRFYHNTLCVQDDADEKDYISIKMPAWRYQYPSPERFKN